MAAPPGRGVQRQRVAVVEGTAPVRGHHDRGLQLLGQLAQLVPRLGGEDPAADEDQRALGPGEEPRRLLQQARIARLEAQVRRLEDDKRMLATERDILRKAAKYFAGETNW